MQVIHSIFREPQRPVKPKRVNPAHERAERRLAVWKQRDIEKALVKFKKEIDEIREYRPGWMPGRNNQ